jgi:hypothetical protein
LEQTFQIVIVVLVQTARSVSWNVAVGLLHSGNPHWSGFPKLVRCKPTLFEGFERFVASPLYLVGGRTV